MSDRYCHMQKCYVRTPGHETTLEHECEPWLFDCYAHNLESTFIQRSGILTCNSARCSMIWRISLTLYLVSGRRLRHDDGFHRIWYGCHGKVTSENVLHSLFSRCRCHTSGCQRPSLVLRSLFDLKPISAWRRRKTAQPPCSGTHFRYVP